MNKVQTFMDEIHKLESESVDKVVQLADRHGIDRNKAITAFANVIVTFANIADISQYEREDK